MRESKVQTKIKNALKKKGWMVVKMIQTSANGWPDLQCFNYPGRTFFIEAKKTDGVARELQEYRHDQLRKMGFVVFVADDKCLPEILNYISS